MNVALHHNPEFSRLSVECIAKLYGVAKPFSYGRRDLIVRQGDKADGLYIMQRGLAKVTVAAEDGKAAILSLVRAGDMFGEIALIDGGLRMASVVALDDVQLLKVSRQDFGLLLGEHPELSLSFARYVCRRVRQADQKIGELALMGLQDRVSKQLHELAMIDETGRLVVPSALSQQDLADMVGGSRERVSGALRALVEAGEVVMEGRSIVLGSGKPQRASTSMQLAM